MNDDKKVIADYLVLKATCSNKLEDGERCSQRVTFSLLFPFYCPKCNNRFTYDSNKATRII